jgi:hypothetical protein
MKTYIFLILLLTLNFSALANTGFRENIGQIKNQNGQPAQAVRYLLHCEGYNVQLRHDGFSYDFIRRIGEEIIIDRVDFIFNDFNSNYSIEKTAPQSPYKTTYVADNGNQQFEKILYKNFYQGIDIVFKRKGEDAFEYDFVISERGNINDIKFNVQGAEIQDVQQNELFISNEFIQFKEIIPLSFDKNGKTVEVFFKRSNQNTISLICSNQNSGITIDPTPVLLYATYTKESWAIWDVKFLDNMDYITLGFGDPIDVATEGAYQTSLVGIFNVILSRFDMSNDLLWSTYFGADITAAYEFVIVDDKIVFCGIAEGNNLPTDGAFQPNNNGSRDNIIGIFTTDGAFEHCTYFGGSQFDQAYGIAYLGNGEVAICGTTDSNDFPTINSSSFYSGATDGFVAVFDIDEKIFSFSSFIGGDDLDFVEDIIARENGAFTFIGFSESSTINNISQSPPAAFTETNNGGDGIVGEVNANNEIEFIGFLGGSGADRLKFGTADNQDRLIIVGRSTEEYPDFTPNAELTDVPEGSSAAIVYIFDNEYNLMYCSLLFSALNIEDGDAVTDENNNIYITLETSSPTNVATDGAIYDELFFNSFNTNFNLDVAIIQLAPSGQKIWGTYFGNYSFQISHALDYKNSLLILAGQSGSDIDYPIEYQSSFLTDDAFENSVSPWGGWIAIFDQLVNVNELEASENTIQIFPNPTSEMINLKGEELQQALCTIYDMTGKAVYSNQLNTPTINIENLPAGIYTLTLQTPSSLRKAKFVKQ